MHLGQSYNPNMVLDATFIQSDAKLIELGFHEISVINELNLLHLFPALSLHMARSPMMEDEHQQTIFLDVLAAAVKRNSFSSLGFHICGPRTSGIGRFGFTPHFFITDDAPMRVRSFIDRVRHIFAGEIWLENANFYSTCKTQSQRTYSFLSLLARQQSLGIILDLSHLFIEARNLRVSTFSLVKEIDLGLVREVHLSGVIEDAHGIFHDGHSQPVREEVWHLLEAISPELPSDCFITIEHSDPLFNKQRESFNDDFNRLRHWLNVHQPASKMVMDPDAYAKRYIAKIVVKQIKNLNAYLDNRGLVLHHEIDRFIAQQKPDRSLVIDKRETDLFPPGHAHHLASEFLVYLNKREQS